MPSYVALPIESVLALTGSGSVALRGAVMAAGPPFLAGLVDVVVVSLMADCSSRLLYLFFVVGIFRKVVLYVFVDKFPPFFFPVCESN